MKSDKVRLSVNQSISLIDLRFIRSPTAALNCSDSQLVSRSLRHHLWTCLRRSGSVSRWQRRTMHCYLRRMFSKDSESSFNTHLISHWKGRHRGEAVLRGFKQPPLLKRYSSVVLCVRDVSRYFVTLCNVYYERTAALPLHRDSLYSSNVMFYVIYHLIPSVYDSTISLSFNLCWLCFNLKLILTIVFVCTKICLLLSTAPRGALNNVLIA